MAADLMGSSLPRRLGWGVLCMMFAVVPAHALTDPTKPPAELSSPAVSRGLAGAREDNGLQAIILSSTRRAAIIDGQTVELGANHGDAKLIEVSESGVVLQGAQGRRQLPLFPGIEMKKKEVLLPMETEVKSATHKAKLDKSAKRIGKKEAK